MLFDSHAHICELGETEEERLAAIREIEEHPLLARIADIGFDLSSSVGVMENAAKYPWCTGVVGVHPHDAASMDESIYEEIRRLALSGASAIGEIGLDYYYMRSPREDQIYWFRRQIALANELAMPIVIHSRDADKETMDILIGEGAFSDERKALFPGRPGPDGRVLPDARVDIHCFSGSAETAAEYVRLGATIGICGPLTYKNNKKTVRVAQETPLEFMMVETDSPYLTPEPLRGRPNRPWYVEHTARRLAVIKRLTFEDVCHKTYRNAMRYYGLRDNDT